MRVVSQISFDEAWEWCKRKHYAKRIPSISYAFGLFDDGILIGIITYGTSPSSTLARGICGAEYAKIVIELNRLCVNDDAPKNTASMLVGRSLRLLPRPAIVASFADMAQGHVGYVYQATNFLYTGLSSAFRDPKVRGLEHQHHTTYGHGLTNQQLQEKFGDRLYFVERSRKHRYIYFLGTKSQVAQMRTALRYAPQPYPKGESKRYDASYRPVVQTRLVVS